MFNIVISSFSFEQADSPIQLVGGGIVRTSFTSYWGAQFILTKALIMHRVIYCNAIKKHKVNFNIYTVPKDPNPLKDPNVISKLSVVF